MDRKNILTFVKLIPIVSAVLSYILVFSSAQAGSATTVTVLLAFFGFVFFFIGRKAAKEDRALKILGILDLLSTLSIILLYVIAFAVFAGAIGGSDAGSDDGGYNYAVEERETGTNIGSFTSETLDGGEVSEAIFADKDVTIVNVWATFCGPCIEEMPDLQALSEELPDNAQVIGIVIDAPPAGSEEGDSAEDWGGDSGNIDLAKEICDQTGVKYTNILASGSVMQAFADVEAVPTTFIVDRSGDLICKAFIGADVEGYKKAVDGYLAGL